MIDAVGLVFETSIEFEYLGGATSTERTLSVQITQRLQRAWASFWQCNMRIYYPRGVRLRTQVRLLK